VNFKVVLAVLGSVIISGCGGEAAGVIDETGELGESASAVCKNALPPPREKLVLDLIDDICGDTWCEGDNDFAFDHLRCRAPAPHSPVGGTCTLDLRIIPRDESHRVFPRSCTTGGFFGFDSLVETAASGYQSLDWDYYLALTDCISQLEAALPR